MRKLLAVVLALSIAPAAFAEGATPSGTTAPAVDPGPATAPAPAGSETPAQPAPTAPVTGVAAKLVANSAAVQRPDGFHLGVSLDHSIGTGTFIQDYYAYVAGSVVLSPSYAFEVKDVKLAASARADFSYEYTPPDPPNTTGRHYDWSDIRLGLSAPAVFTEKITGISVSPRVGLTLPISMASHFRGVITSLSGGVALGRGFGKFNVGANIGASKTLYTDLTRRISPEEAAAYRQRADNVVFICRTDSAVCGLEGLPMPTLWVLSGGIEASYSLTERLSFSAGLNLSKAFKYPVGVDDLTTKARYSDGTPVGQAQATADRMVGQIGVAYALTDAVSLSGGMGTDQTPRTLDGKRWRFPFYDFEGPELSRTSFSLALSAEF